MGVVEAPLKLRPEAARLPACLPVVVVVACAGVTYSNQGFTLGSAVQLLDTWESPEGEITWGGQVRTREKQARPGGGSGQLSRCGIQTSLAGDVSVCPACGWQ